VKGAWQVKLPNWHDKRGIKSSFTLTHPPGILRRQKQHSRLQDKDPRHNGPLRRVHLTPGQPLQSEPHGIVDLDSRTVHHPNHLPHKVKHPVEASPPNQEQLSRPESERPHRVVKRLEYNSHHGIVDLDSKPLLKVRHPVEAHLHNKEQLLQNLQLSRRFVHQVQTRFPNNYVRRLDWHQKSCLNPRLPRQLERSRPSTQ